MKQIVVSGFGGQGVLSLGLMLAYAAMKEEKNTSFLPSYGPEMRGGTANCSVVVSDTAVASPVISRPDILVAFNEPSLTRFLPSVAADGKVFADADVASKQNFIAQNVTAVPLGELCGKNPKGRNLCMLGVVFPHTGLSLAAVEDAVRQTFKHKPEFIDANLACLHAGYAWAQKAGVC